MNEVRYILSGCDYFFIWSHFLSHYIAAIKTKIPLRGIERYFQSLDVSLLGD